jgi:ribonuclease P protein component
MREVDKGSHGIPKEQRLKSRKLIEALFAEGHRFYLAPFRIFYLSASLGVPLQAGFGVGARNFRKAVDRNRIRRLTREAWRLQKKDLEDCLRNRNQQWAVFVLYTGKDMPDYNQVYSKMRDILLKLTRLADENRTASA